jgi:hypothetical protein
MDGAGLQEVVVETGTAAVLVHSTMIEIDMAVPSDLGPKKDVSERGMIVIETTDTRIPTHAPEIPEMTVTFEIESRG